MLDYRYERHQLVSTSQSSDRYNAIGTPGERPIEFWTNGTTTLILNSQPVSDSALVSSSSQMRKTPSHERSDFSNSSIMASSAASVKNSTLMDARQSSTITKNDNSVRSSLVAGSAGGIASTLACHPFDVIRTKMQSAAMESAISTSGSSTTTAARPRSVSAGPLTVVSHTLKHGGFRALYTGLALPLAAQAVYKATVFTVNNVTQSALLDWHTRERRKTGIFAPYSLTLTDKFICGFVGGGVNAALFVTPVEYVRNQLIGQHSKRAAGQKVITAFMGPIDVVRYTLQSKKGVLGLWRGIGVTVARDSIGCGCFFYAMALSQRYLAPDGSKASLSVTICSGAAAGLSYWLAALPLDSVKTWVQSDMADSAIGSVQASLRERGVMPTIRRLFSGFSGFQVAYARGIPSAAITVTTYSVCYNALQQNGSM